MKASTEDFDLRRLVVAEVDSSAVADPHIIAEHVAKQIPKDRVWDALDECLHHIVREVIRSHRFTPAPTDNTTGKGSGRTPSANEAMVVWYRRTLRKKIEVGEDEREWKFLADCTADDLRRAAARNYRLAESNRAAGDRLTALADVVDRDHAETVVDLDPSVIAEVMP